MMLQGAWVAELSELDTLSRTEEPRLKAFITMREDSYIPKYSNFRQRTQRRAIFIGTTNEPTFLKGLSGNTRYLPLQLPLPIDLAQFCAMRTQLFAEALLYYHAHPDDWWQLSPDALDTARDEREQRRVESVYEHPLHEWLEYGRFAEVVFDQGTPVSFVKEETSWPEIARWFLKLDTPEKWKDRSLQMQIASALKGLGWAVKQARRNGRNMKIWQKEPTHV
jgi:predicted P-loop ATPase